MRIELDAQSRALLANLSVRHHVAINRGIRQGLYYTGKNYVKFAKDEIRKPKHGRIYRIRKGGKVRRHQASAPGEYPARMTGNLNNQMGFNVPSHDTLVFGNNAEYARMLEFGTSRMAARPYLRPTIQRNSNATRQYLEQRIMWALEQELR